MLESKLKDVEDKNDIASIRHAQLCTIIINMHKSGDSPPAKIEDFLSEEIVKKIYPKPEITEADQVERIIAAGNAYIRRQEIALKHKRT
jgi:hypothetical protein